MPCPSGELIQVWSWALNQTSRQPRGVKRRQGGIPANTEQGCLARVLLKSGHHTGGLCHYYENNACVWHRTQANRAGNDMPFPTPEPGSRPLHLACDPWGLSSPSSNPTLRCALVCVDLNEQGG